MHPDYQSDRTRPDADLAPADVQGGALTMQSYLRPLYLYTVSQRAITGKIGELTAAKLAEAVQALKSQVDPTLSGQ